MYKATTPPKRRARRKKPVPIRGPEDAELVLRRYFGDGCREVFAIILLNARHEILGVETISVGSLNASIVHPREVFRPAMIKPAASIILAHNHPSGDPEPSEEDLSITKRLVEVGEIHGIQVLDHLIVADRGIVSFRSRKLL